MPAKVLPLVLVVALLACSGPVGTGPASPSPTPAPSAAVSLAHDASPPPEIADCDVAGNGDYPHNAPALEAVLPKTVAGRDLTIWSVAGWCWVLIGVGAEALAQFRPIASAESIQIETMQYALAGRSNTEDDPPYFVHVLRYPEDQTTNEFAIYLFWGSIGVLDPESLDLFALTSQVVGGKEVLYAPPELLDQSEHSRGGAYLRDAGDYLFAVLTDDLAWAEDALTQLP